MTMAKSVHHLCHNGVNKHFGLFGALERCFIIEGVHFAGP